MSLPQIWSCGGGTQSCAIGALIVQGKLPKPDIAVIADTGYEVPTTWKYLDSVLRPELAKVGVEIHRVTREEFACPWGKQIFATGGQLMLPAYTNQSGEPSKLSGFCSGAWKQEVVDKWLSVAHGLTRSNYAKWIGFSADETRRIGRICRGKEFRSGLIQLPLVTGHRAVRSECVYIVESIGWPTPPRSRCWFCPNQADAEWHEVKTDYPELFQEATRMDEQIRERDPHAFLHSSLTTLRNAEINPKEDLFSAGCPSGECFL